MFLAACANIEATEIPVVTATKAIPTTIPTNTPLPPTPLPLIKPTTEIPCDPFRVDFCITDGHFILQRPIHPPANDLVDETYGYASTANGTREPHHGVEFPNKSGTPVYAAADGTIIFAGPDQIAVYSPWVNFYGNLVVIKHNDDLFTLYAHLSKIDVEEGQAVSAGDKIGEVGRTGVAIGSHLHFEVRHGNGEDYFATQNPELWLIPAKDANGDPFGTLMIFIVDQNHHLIKYAKFSIGYYSDRSQPPIKTYYEVTYSADMLNGDENAVLGELSTGTYRIVLERNGQIDERWVEVESGKLTQVAFVVK
jgi:hypothetical protein